MIGPRHIFASLALALGLALAAGEAAAQAANRITVTGQGEVSAKPDVAWLSVGVSEDAPTAAEAAQAMSDTAARILDRLSRAGIPPANVQTSQLSLEQPADYPEEEPRRPGWFRATTMLEVRVEDLSILGRVIDAVLQDGANRLGGVRFDVSDRQPLLARAQRAAVDDAEATARRLARAADVRLGRLRHLREGGIEGGPMPYMDMGLARESGAMPIATGEITVSATVTMVYAISR